MSPSAPDAAPGSVATLRPGDDVDAVFACTRKERLMTRGGDPYLAVELRDRSAPGRDNGN
jgi:3'-5' exoribonuclease